MSKGTSLGSSNLCQKWPTAFIRRIDRKNSPICDRAPAEKNPVTEKFLLKFVDAQDSVRVKLNCRSAGMTSTHMVVREVLQPGKAQTMSFIAEIVRRATRQQPAPPARVRGKSPRARLRCEALS